MGTNARGKGLHSEELSHGSDENRELLPAGFKPEELGQAMIKTTAYSQAIPELDDLPLGSIIWALVSYLTSPLTKDLLNQYVVFIIDPDLVAGIASYQWDVYKTIDVGVVPVLISSSVTEEGVFDYRPTEIGEFTISVSLKDAQNQILDSLEMKQSVIPFSEEFDARVNALATTISRFWSDWKPDITIGKAKITNELVNDLYQYILDAVEEPIDGQTNQIPWQLLAAIAYREMFFSPKESPTGTTWDKPNRTNEMWLYRNYVNEVNYGFIDVADWSLGICQMQPQTLATALTNPVTQTTYTPFLEEDKTEQNGKLIADQRLQAYLALSEPDRIDLFNLLRFPKTHLRMCNILLQKLKNRSTRVPLLDDEALLADQKGIQIIATEYNQGPTTSTWNDVGENAYGREVWTIVNSPMMNAVPTLSNLILDFWGVVVSDSGAPLFNVRVDLYETEVISETALKFWKRKEDFKDAAAPFGHLVVEQTYRVLEIERNFSNNNQLLDLVKVSVVTDLWDKDEGWIIAREGDTYYANLISVRRYEETVTDNVGKFKILYLEKAPIKLRFIKEADANGNGYFDGETGWGMVPNYFKVVMQAADHMVKEDDLIALLPDWEGYVYSIPWNANFPSNYYLGEDNEAVRGFHITEVDNLEIACNSFSQAMVTEAWFRRYPLLHWRLANYIDYMNIGAGFDPFGSMTETLNGDGTITMATQVDISENRPPPDWSLIQGWRSWSEANHSGTGHSFIIVDHHPGTGRVLTIEANHDFLLNGVGFRCVGNVEDQKHADFIIPNVDRLWIEKDTVTWQETKDLYDALGDSAHNPNNQENPIGIVRLKVYDCHWSGAEVM